MIPMPSWTDLHKIRRRLYRIHDVRLPVPTTFVQAAAASAVLLFTKLLLGWLGVDFGARTSVVYIAPALAAFWVAGRDSTDGRTAVQWGLSRVRFLFAPRLLVIGAL